MNTGAIDTYSRIFMCSVARIRATFVRVIVIESWDRGDGFLIVILVHHLCGTLKMQ
jgi:hypothetical protein